MNTKIKLIALNLIGFIVSHFQSKVKDTYEDENGVVFELDNGLFFDFQRDTSVMRVEAFTVKQKEEMEKLFFLLKKYPMVRGLLEEIDLEFGYGERVEKDLELEEGIYDNGFGRLKVNSGASVVNRIEDGARYEVFLDKHGKTGYRVWSMEDVLNGRWRMDQVKLKRTRSDEYIWFTASKKVAEEKLNEFVLEMSRN